MFCQQCGTQIEDGLAFCTTCGAKQISAQTNQAANTLVTPSNTTPVQPAQNQYVQQNNQGYAPQGYAQPNTYAYSNESTTGSPKRVGFGEAIKLFFINYVNFTGRSTASEYWWAFLFNFLVSLCTAWIPVVGQLISLGLLLPGLALGIRRLHDTGKAWYYMFMGLIPLAGFIILIIQYCKESDADNQWGPAPRI